ncbi:MAG: nicotinamidase [Desulfobacterales bacterium]|jgi:nicotinamidase/pyrazinamidase
MLNPFEIIENKDAVLVVDVQKDFCPGGALPIKDGDAVVPVLNQWIDAAFLKGATVYLTRDWHPVNHPSFKNFGGPWPPHCIQDTDGARFHPDLKRPENAVVVTKGVRFDFDQYSVFDQTGLGKRLKGDRVRTLWVGGLAQDVCVLHSVLDALKEGFKVKVIGAATRPVSEKDGREAIEKMKTAGALII